MRDVVWDVAVIGAGAAGLLAASRAAELGRRVLLLEKNQKAGVKILMSGGTRCNLTHATDNRGIVEAFGSSGSFLHSALASLSVDATIELFEAEGVPTKVEETGKIFPLSNKAYDVLTALLRRLHRSGAILALGEPVLDMQQRSPHFSLTTPRQVINARRVILTTGGQSYPGSGTTGDGYRFAAQVGHSIIPPRPALVPLTVAAPWVAELRGITLPHVVLRVSESSRVRATCRGSLLFAHFGLSGPAALDISRVVSSHPQPQTLTLEVDLLPEMKEADLDEFLRTESLASGKKLLSAVLSQHLPRRFCDVLLALSSLPVERKAAVLSRTDRIRLIQSIKHLRLPLTGTLGFAKAEVTAGGISLQEVDSRNMRSQRLPDLFLAGEVLDLDGPIGGYNFQAAWSTGWLAGTMAATLPT